MVCGCTRSPGRYMDREKPFNLTPLGIESAFVSIPDIERINLEFPTGMLPWGSNIHEWFQRVLSNNTVWIFAPGYFTELCWNAACTTLCNIPLNVPFRYAMFVHVLNSLNFYNFDNCENENKTQNKRHRSRKGSTWLHKEGKKKIKK